MQGGKITLRVQYNFAVVGMLYRGKMNHCYSITGGERKEEK